MPLLPNGFYQGQLIKIDEGDYWTWTFVVDYHGRKHYLKAFTSGKPYGKAKAYAEALFDRDLERGEELDADLLTGLSASLGIGTVRKNGWEYNSIENIVWSFPLAEGFSFGRTYETSPRCS